MLQRIQTVYLVVATLLGVLGLINPVAIFLKGAEAITMGAFTHTAQVEGFLGAWPIGVLWVLCMAVLIATVFQYKNRPLQLRVTATFFVLLLALGALQFLLASQLGAALGTEYSVNYNWSVFLPFVSATLVFLARMAIKKDEKLIRSVDRLR